jgi:hypothetical protein
MTTTPAHDAGSVDVVLNCGSSSLVIPNGFTFGETRTRRARH